MRLFIVPFVLFLLRKTDVGTKICIINYYYVIDVKTRRNELKGKSVFKITISSNDNILY